MRLTKLILRSFVCALILAKCGSHCQKIKSKRFSPSRRRFLVIVDEIVAAYSLVHEVRCVVGMMKGSILFSKPLAWPIFSGDQAVAYLTVAAVGAVAVCSLCKAGSARASMDEDMHNVWEVL